MKNEKQKTIVNNSSGKKTVRRRARLLTLICVAAVTGLFAFVLHNFGAVSVAALEIPSDYGTGYEISNLDDLENDGSFEGILCRDKVNKVFVLTFSDDVNGLVTLARISQNCDLKDYTFEIAVGASVILEVKYNGADALSAGSFFGIGNDTYPFKGKIVVGGSADTAIALGENSWRFLFNNISNEASIISSGNYRLYSSYADQNLSPQEAESFTFCRTLTVTENDCALQLSGFRFGAADETGHSGAYVFGSGPMALFAGKVTTGGASSFSVDLSSSITSGIYVVKSSDDHAGGLIGTVDAGVEAEIKLPNSLSFKVTAGGTQKNAGILIGSNNGNVTFLSRDGSTISFSGELSATGSAGLVGANEDGSTATFSAPLSVDSLTASGLRAGGIAGTCKGTITVNSAVEIKNSTFTKISVSDVGRLGGAVGSVDRVEGGLYVADGISVELSDNTFSSANDCYIGGYIGALNTSGIAVQNVTVSNTTITGGGSNADRIGGYIGSLTATGDFSVALGSNTSVFTFNGISAGVCGGVIGYVNAPLQNNVLISGKGTSDVSIQCTINNTAATVGGLVGKVNAGYVKVDALSLDNSIKRASSAADLVGGLEAGSMLDIGDLTLVEANGSVLVGTTGQGSVVRLGGAINDSSANVVNLVYQQNASLIYKDTGCTYSGAVSTNNDIGNYGQVVRNDSLQVIAFDEGTHRVSISSPLDGSGELSIGSREDFAKLAITFHTKGAVLGVTGAEYSALFGKTINLTADVSLENTGIEQLTPSNDMTVPFTGDFYGGGHTVTLDIGQNISGAYPGIIAGGNNARSSLALFSCLRNATVEGVKIGGKITLSQPDFDQYVGSLAGKAYGTLSIKNCEVDTAITLNSANVTNKRQLYVGGMVGYIGDVSSLSATGCTLGASIADNTKYNKDMLSLFLGGLSGYVKYTGSADSIIYFKGNTIKTSITKSNAYTDLIMGGFVGELVCSNYAISDMSGTTAENVQLTATAAAGSAGGILGYSFDKCHVILDSAYTSTESAGSASLGGLLYTLNGRLTVNKGFSMSGTSLTATGGLRGLLLANGKDALVTIKADPSGFNNVTADDGFDLFVGENINEYTTVKVASNGGIVTIETGDETGKLPADSSAWYGLINARPNTKTRYYFNIAAFESKSDASETIENAEALLYFHVFDYAQSLPYYVKTEFFKTTVNNIRSVTANIDMTPYCFYPTKKEAVSINFSDKQLTLGRPGYVASANQFFGLQAGLLSDITASSAVTTVEIRNIKLCGTVSYLDGSLPGSGALICGTVFGSKSGSNSYYVNLTLSDIVISGLRVESASDYRPLLVNRIASYVEATVSGVSQEEYDGISSAASSLIGRGGVIEGSTPSSYIKMTLVNIVLDGKSDSAIFTKATLFYDVSYVSGSGSFIYNFNFSEDWAENGNHLSQVTYGAELYFNEDQQQYFDKSINVNPDSKPTESSGVYDFSDYLPYVYTGYGSAAGKVNLNLSVNRKGTNFIEGYGTYRNPYIIVSSKQLEYISKLLSGNDVPFSDDWKINFPQGNWSSVSSLDLTGYYLVQAKDGILHYADNDSVTLSRDVLLSYLSGAYFKLADGTELTLSSEYAGLGSTSYPFHGVVHGSGSTVIMPGTDAENAVGSYGYGFINVANGCAVYDLSIRYGAVVLSSDEFTSTQNSTSGPSDSTLSTSLPHFGGAIAWVVGGDNLIDSVSVTATSVTPGASNTVCGGYVGLISGGGVLLNTLSDVSAGVFDDRGHLYHNNYIGRVLSGYAIAIDGVSYNNGKTLSSLGSHADFVIPAITKAALTGHNSGFSANTFTLGTAQEVLLLSFGMNCGAFTGNNGYAYGKTSLSRYGDYSKVGDEDAPGVTDGKYIDDTNKTCILSSYFGISTPTDLRYAELTIKLTEAEYDMRGYGNAFRAMSGAYSNSPTYKIIYFGNDSSMATIRLDMDMLQYAVGEKSSKDASYPEADSVRYYGLLGRISSNVKFENLVLTGKISLSCINRSNAIMESNPFARFSLDSGCVTGGFVGYSSGTATFTGVSLKDIEVKSPDVCGGFVGRYQGTALTVESGCSYNNAKVLGKRHAGGVAGHVGSGTVSVTGLTGENSIVESRVDLTYASSDTLYGTAGGVFGQATVDIAIDQCSIKKTAVVYMTNFKSTSQNVASGGLVGVADKNVNATKCTIDGCVVLAVSNLSGGYKFPDTLTPSNISILPPELRDALIYNREKQNVANILAWMLEQNSTNNSGYAVGAAGGLIGFTKNGNLTFDSCTVSSNSAPCVIIGFDNTGGFVGNQRNTSANTTVTITDCALLTGGYDMYIVATTRASGLVSYREEKSGYTSTYTIERVQVKGSEAHPIRILGLVYYTSDAGGLFGDLNKITITVKDSQISDCIIAGMKAGGACSAVNKASTITFTNLHVSNNLIYSKHSGTYCVGGLFGELGSVAVTLNINGAYLGKNCIVGLKGAGGLAGRLQSSNTLFAKYIILNDNVIRKINSLKVTNFTFAANPLTENAAANALFNSTKTGFTNVGLIASSNTGTVTALAVSCSHDDAGNTRQKNFYSGTGTVVYAAYGAQEEYGGYEVSVDIKTPQQIAIEQMNHEVSTSNGSIKMYGDSVSSVNIGTLEVPEMINTPKRIAALTWWPYYVFSLDESDIANLGDKVTTAVSPNATLPLFCLDANTDETMKGYLNMLTGGGFESAVEIGLVNVESKRYSVGEDGVLTDLSTSGSVVFLDGKFSVGVYDNLDGDSKTLTVLTVTFKDSDSNSVYTMHLAIYYHRAVNISTFVVPVEGEQYYIPSFLSFITEPTGSLRANVSYGSPFTLYVEYNYNDMAMNLEQMTNFNKQLELTGSNGFSNESAYIESQTAFILIDLNSATPAGYSYYTLVLDKNERFVDFNSFKNGETAFSHIELAKLQTIAYLSSNRVCKDTSDCVYTEKYLLVVFPIQNSTDSAFTYNMKAVIDEEQRKETNIAVKYLKSVYAQVSVWGSPEVEHTASYVDDTADKKQFSNIDKPILMNVDSKVTFPDGYVTALQSQNGGVFGTHILRLQNNGNNQYVELPMRTVVTVMSKDGEEIYKQELTEPTSQILFSVGDLLKKGITNNAVEMSYQVTLDFSAVNPNDFNSAFYVSGQHTFTLVDSIYLSGSEELLGAGSANEAFKEYTANMETAVKLAVIPTDNRYLGINLAKPDDVTNSGEIEFSLGAKFDAFAYTEFSKMTVSFSVSKKIYNGGKYEYIDLQSTDSLKWSVYKDGNATPIESDELAVVNKESQGTYRLVVDLGERDKLELTNYRLIVHISATGSDETHVTESEYFVFLICNLEIEPDY